MLTKLFRIWGICQIMGGLVVTRVRNSQREKAGLASIAALILFVFAQALGYAHAAHEHDQEFSIEECAVCNLKTHDDDASQPAAAGSSSHLYFPGENTGVPVYLQRATVQLETVRTRGPPLA